METLDKMATLTKEHLSFPVFEDENANKTKPVYTYHQHKIILKEQGATHFEKWQPPKQDTETGEAKIKDLTKLDGEEE